MSRKFSILFIFFILTASFSSVSFAATGVPKMLSHQGLLLDGSANILGGGGTNYCFRFSIYDDATVGAPDTKLWPENNPSTMTVNVKNGIYGVNIGDTSAGGDSLATLNFNSDNYFLNIEIANSVDGSCAGVSSFENLSPRKQITAAGYAINSSLVGGYTPSQSATGDQVPVLTSDNLELGGSNPEINVTESNSLTIQGGADAGNTLLNPISGNVGIGTTTPYSMLSISNSASTPISTPLLTIASTTAGNSTSTLVTVLANGKVGIGTTTPWRKLSVTGTVGFDGLAGATGTGSLCLDSNKQVVYNGGSDACLSSTRATKHDIAKLTITALDILNNLQPSSFVYNEGDGRTRWGFIAEDVRDIHPSMATYNEDGGITGIDDRAIVSLTVKAVQELTEEKNTLKARVDKLETIFSVDTSTPIDYLHSLIKNSLIQTLTYEKVYIENASINHAQISNLDVFENFRVTDKKTGDLYCIYIENGQLLNSKCGENNDSIIQEKTTPDKDSEETEKMSQNDEPEVEKEQENLKSDFEKTDFTTKETEEPIFHSDNSEMGIKKEGESEFEQADYTTRTEEGESEREVVKDEVEVEKEKENPKSDFEETDFIIEEIEELIFHNDNSEIEIKKDGEPEVSSVEDDLDLSL